LGDYSSSGSNNWSESDLPVPHPPTAVVHHAGLPRMAFGPGCLLQAAVQACQLAAPNNQIRQARLIWVIVSLQESVTTWLGA